MTPTADPSSAVRERAEAFCARHCPPEMEACLDRNPSFPAELHRALAAEGLLAHALPREAGGGGRSLRDLTVLAETLGAHSHAGANLLFVHHACGALLAAAGTTEQQERWLGPLTRGELRFAFALTEPEAGSDAGALATRARRTAHGYMLHGTKLYATGGRGAAGGRRDRAGRRPGRLRRDVCPRNKRSFEVREPPVMTNPLGNSG